MSTNQQIEKIRSRTVEKLFGSHHKIFILTLKTHKQFLGKRGIKCRPINKSETRSTVNIRIPSRDQNCRVFSFTSRKMCFLRGSKLFGINVQKNCSEGRNFEGVPSQKLEIRV